MRRCVGVVDGKGPAKPPADGTELAAVFFHLLMVFAAQAFNFADGQLSKLLFRNTLGCDLT